MILGDKPLIFEVVLSHSGRPDNVWLEVSILEVLKKI
jgi:hypothetical protein